MQFKGATDRLLEAGVTLPELAEEIGCSAGLLRQARLDPDASSYRSPPDGWREAAARVARRRGGDLCELAEDLEGDGATS